MGRNRPNRRRLRRLSQALAAGLILGWFCFLRPTSLGGPASYMLVVGQSMDPTLSQGTLIVSVSQSAYNVGDVVAFAPPQTAGAAPMVIHRLVGGSATDGYLTRGDNNEVADPWTVLPDAIVGRQVLAVPGAATWLSVLRSPLVVASLTAALVTYSLAGVLFPTRRKPQPAPHGA